MTVIKWAWSQYNLYADEFDTLDDAIASASAAADAGVESLHCIEVVDGDRRRIITYDSPEFRKYEEAKRSAWRREIDTKRTVATIYVRPPMRDSADMQTWAWYGQYKSRDDAEAAASRLAETLGADRVRVEDL